MKRNSFVILFGVSLFGSLMGVGILFILLNTTAVQAAGVVTNCTGQGLADAMNSGSGLITFDCGADPVVITVTQAGGFYHPNFDYTIDGGNLVTLSGGDANRLFTVKAGRALTLTKITLTHGNASALGDLPTQGGALLNEGVRLVLDHVTIHNSQSSYAGGAIDNAGGTTILINSLIENNQSQYGGGIDSVGVLTLTNTIVRNNHATLHDGGGLDVGGKVVIIDSQIVSNTAYGDREDGGGGGINIVASGRVSISGSQINGNQTPTQTSFASGGAIRNFGVLIISQSTINDNGANFGGGLYNVNLHNVNTSVATLTNVSFNGNLGGIGGGGIYNNYGSMLTLNNVTLSDNYGADGGGLFNYATTTVNNSTLSDNSALYGGGLYNLGMAKLTNSTVSGNSATVAGGGLYNQFDIGLLNVTVSNNSAPSGGGLFMKSGYTTTLTNMILAYSSAGGNCSGTVTAATFSFSSDNSCALSGLVNGHSANSLDPLLTTLGNYGGPTLVHMLKVGSPAIGGVLGNDAPPSDQRGQPRPGPDGSYDIGTVERQPDDSNGTQSQTISFGALADKTLDDAAFAVSASASSGLAVSFSSRTTAICTISNKTVTLVAVGNCTIRASQAGDASYLAAPNVDRSFRVQAAGPANQTISFGPLSDKNLGDAPFALNATASSGLQVSYAALTPAVCTVASNNVTLVGAGTCTIRASQSGDAAYRPAADEEQSFAIRSSQKQNQTTIFDQPANRTLGEATFVLTATTTSGLPVTFTSLTTPVCTVTGKVVTLVAAGACSIRATQDGNATYNAATPIVRTFAVSEGDTVSPLFLPAIEHP